MEIVKMTSDVWSEIEFQINKSKKTYSSENSVVFNYAWEFQKNNRNIIQSIDFEVPLFKDFSDGKFLDLLISVKDSSQQIKIGFEFKFPQRKLNGSGQTQIRPKIINDIKRLSWLVEKNIIDFGVFLCATNEKGYINKGNFRKYSEFETYHKKVYSAGEFFPFNSEYSEQVKIQKNIKFEWNNVLVNSNKISIKDEKYSFLEPIIIFK
ncbi:hypothetical protein N9L43_00675 [bacterium]|nr:hypothetical protein [bacterium]